LTAHYSYRPEVVIRTLYVHIHVPVIIPRPANQPSARWDLMAHAVAPARGRLVARRFAGIPNATFSRCGEMPFRDTQVRISAFMKVGVMLAVTPVLTVVPVPAVGFAPWLVLVTALLFVFVLSIILVARLPVFSSFPFASSFPSSARTPTPDHERRKARHNP